MPSCLSFEVSEELTSFDGVLQISNFPDSLTTDDNANFNFNAPEAVPPVSYMCSEDGTNYIQCDSKSYSYTSLSDGEYEFYLKAIDGEAKESEVFSYSWIVDTTPPTGLALSNQPSDPSGVDNASINFSAIEANGNIVYECSTDNVIYTPCSSPYDLSGLTDDNYNFYVRAKDQLDNTSTVVSHSWEVELPATHSFNDLANQNRLEELISNITQVNGIGMAESVLVSGSGPNRSLSEINNLTGHTFNVPFGIRDMILSPDGLILFTMDDSEIYQYNLRVAFDVTTAEYASEFDYSSEATFANSFALNDTGTKLFLADSSDQTIFQYSMSAYDLSTISYDSVNFDFSGEATESRSIKFSDNGSRLFLFDGYDLFEYQLTPFDLSTVSYTGNSVTLFSGFPGGDAISFNNDGSKMFVFMGNWDATIQQYSLAIPYSLLSAPTYDSVSISMYNFVGELVDYHNMHFSNDGSKLYVVNSNYSKIDQYDLGTNFDISSVIFNIFSIFNPYSETLSSNNYNFMFNNDGSKLYVFSPTAGYQYSLPSPYNTATAVHDSISYDFSAQETFILDGDFNNDGTKFFLLGFMDADTIHQYTLSTPYDFSTISYDSINIDLSAQGTGMGALAFRNDGLKMYVLNFNNRTVFQYSLSSAYDVQSATYDSISLDLSGTASGFTLSLGFSNDGTKLFFTDDFDAYIFDLSTAWDLATASQISSNNFASIYPTNISTIRFNPDGSSLYTMGSLTSLGSHLLQIPINTSWSFDFDTYNTTKIEIGSNLTGFEISDDGSKMYVSEHDTIYQFDLSVAHDIKSQVYNSVSLDVSTPGGTQSLKVVNSGSKLILLDSYDDSFHSYTLSTAYDISTATYDSISFDISSQEATPIGFSFYNSGNNLLLVGYNNTIYQYSLSSAYDISTMSYDSISYDLSSADSSGSRKLSFNSDGTKLFVLFGSYLLHEFNLTTAYDITSLSYTGHYFNTQAEVQYTRGLIYHDEKITVMGTGRKLATYELGQSGIPEYRICSDDSCSSVLTDWTTTGGSINNGEYIQLRMMSSGEDNSTSSATVTIDGDSDLWEITTEP